VIATRRIPIEAFLLAMLLAAGVSTHRVNLGLERWTEARAVAGDVGPLPNGKALRVGSLGFERLVADLFWLRTVYYVGDPRTGDVGYPAAEGLAHLVTDIDPSFESVYVLMNSVLSGLRMDADAAIRLLEKGTRHSDYWRIYFLLGFNHFMEKGDYLAGAHWIEEAAKRGGPPYLPLLASRLYSQAGDPDTALAFLATRLQQERHPALREQLQKRMTDVWITRDLDRIDAAIVTYRELRGSDPIDVAALVREGLLEREPRDPRGEHYAIRSGRATSFVEFERLRLKTLEEAS
jgi:hypothetical protein